MTADQLIEEIMKMAPAERAKLLAYLHTLDHRSAPQERPKSEPSGLMKAKEDQYL
jgi:hypothetical protein